MSARVIFSSILFSISLFSFSQTYVRLAPLQQHAVGFPMNINHYYLISGGQEFSSSLSVRKFFSSRFNAFVEMGLVGFDQERVFTGDVNDVKLYGNKIIYSRLESATYAGLEYWLWPVERQKFNITIGVAGGLWTKLTESHHFMLEPAQAGFKSQLGFAFPIKDDYITLTVGYGMRWNGDVGIPFLGYGISYDLNISGCQ